MTTTRSTTRPRPGSSGVPTPPPPPSPAAAPTRQPNRVHRWLTAIDNRMARWPGLDYLMIRTIVLVLIGIGVLMAYSSSMTWSIIESSSVWNEANRQLAFVAVGLVLFWVALKIPLGWVRSLSHVVMGISVLLLVAVLISPLGTGRDSVGSQSWLVIGSFQLQPSEVVKVAIAVWGATFLASDRHQPATSSRRMGAFIVVAVSCFFLIALQGDLGMAFSFLIVVAFVLIFAGIRMGILVIGGIVAALSLLVVFLSGGFRSQRFHTYFGALTGNFDDTQGSAFQSYQGFLSLADGSVTGVGLGQSRAKWFYLPEARNDFIFAIIGEEFGLWGGVLVIVLFALLGFFGLRTAMRAQNQFQSLLAASLTMGVVSQAFINIGYVVGLLPVTGIQLPMISAGGTSAVITIASMGLLASAARHEPESISAMQNYGRPLFDRVLFIGEPELEADEVHRLQAARARRGKVDRTQRYGRPVTAGRNAAADPEAESYGGEVSRARVGRAGSVEGNRAREHHNPRGSRASSSRL